MYLGILAILSGASLIMGSIPALVAPVGFFQLMNNIFIPGARRHRMRLSAETKYYSSQDTLPKNENFSRVREPTV
jgi:hypothetical protein